MDEHAEISGEQRERVCGLRPDEVRLRADENAGAFKRGHPQGRKTIVQEPARAENKGDSTNWPRHVIMTVFHKLSRAEGPWGQTLESSSATRAQL